LGIGVLLLGSAAFAGDPVRRVSASAAPGGDGLTWETAFNSLQDALLLADGKTVTEIWVAAGVYRPDEGVKEVPGDRFATFRLINNVGLYGGFFGTENFRFQRDPSLHTTVLSGDLNEDDGFGSVFENSFHVVVGNGVDATAVLDGFVISGGYANGTAGNADRGAGMLLSESAPTVGQCRFSRNQAIGPGGGVRVQGVSLPIFRSCDFFANQAGFVGGGMDVEPGSSAALARCQFVGNEATRGGNMHVGGSFLILANCLFNGGRAEAGGAIYFVDGLSFVTNCLVSGNEAVSGAGIQIASDAELIATNCTIAENRASVDGGGAFISTTGDVLIKNTIAWGNSDFGGQDESAQLRVLDTNLDIDYCRLQGWTGVFGGNGNSGEDPQLMNPAGEDNTIGTLDDDYRLVAGSSAIDAGSNDLLPSDNFDLDNDQNQDEPHPLDLNDKPRQVDDPFTFPDPGQGFAPVVDIGAYEFFRDCNGNGIPDDIDIEVGTSTDCNQNRIPDECEIESCPGDPRCDDCNLNGLPDSCDIESGSSNDRDGNGIPDECVFFTGEVGEAWSDPGNWSGGIVPNNKGELMFSVTVGGADAKAIVDISVIITTLRVTDGATVGVVKECDCDLRVVGAGGILNLGKMYVDFDRVVFVPNGPYVIGQDGIYAKWPFSQTETSSSLVAKEVLMLPTTCGSPEQLTLVDQMALITSGALEMDGRGAVGCGTVAGGQTPPILKALPATDVVVGTDFKTVGGADVSNDPPASLGGTPDDFPVFMTVNGNVVNESVVPELYQLSDATIVLNGGGVFEVAGEVFGASQQGFGTPENPNFSLGRLEIAPGSKVLVANQVPNLVSDGPCQEALYVRELVVRGGSFVLLEDARVYYEWLIIEDGAGVKGVGCGAVVQVCPFDVALLNGSASVDCNVRPGLPEFAGFQNCYTGPGNNLGLSQCCSAFDFNFDSSVDESDFDTYAKLLSGTGDCCEPNSTCGCEAADVEYCVCAIDPFCCNLAWDGTCVGRAVTECGLACPNHDCCVQGSPGCDDQAVEDCVCAIDPFCCASAWDSICVDLVNSNCGGGCGP
jgi:hypothetical protein